jgi:hypothetical protein|tara:strand:+ start:522 stop:698 length:177 start_codon:yes stop_codon:yes gene_type:complete
MGLFLIGDVKDAIGIRFGRLGHALRMFTSSPSPACERSTTDLVFNDTAECVSIDLTFL